MGIQEQFAVHMCGFDGRGNCFGGEPIGRAEVEIGVGKPQVRMRSQEK